MDKVLCFVLQNGITNNSILQIEDCLKHGTLLDNFEMPKQLTRRSHWISGSKLGLIPVTFETFSQRSKNKPSFQTNFTKRLTHLGNYD